MGATRSWLNGKKTYLVAALMVLSSGLYAQGYITESTYRSLEGLLVGTGLITLRAGVTKSS